MKKLFKMKKIEQSIMPIAVVFGCLTAFVGNASALVTEFVPRLYIAEDYTDNYDKTETDKIEEFYTTYGIDLSLGFIQKTTKVTLSYNPEFKDYHKNNSEDSWEHNASLVGEFRPSRKSSVNIGLNYDGHGDNNDGNNNDEDAEGDNDGDNNGSESWEHGASLDVSYEFSKYSDAMFAADYSNSYVRQLRDGEWKESEDYTFSSGATHRFGKNDSVEFDYTYSMTEYEDPDDDDNDEHKPSLFMAYWLTPQTGLDSNLSYEYTVYDTSEDESETWSGDIRLIRKLTKRFQVYGKYEHTYTEKEPGDSTVGRRRNAGNHTVYHPSVGFDWAVSEDSGVSLGVGYMFQEWENQGNSNREGSVFFDADVFKTYNFSRRGAFTLSASSGYDATGDEAASLGFNIYYQTGFLLSYQLRRNLSSQLKGSYKRDEFDDPEVDRVDNTLEFGAGLSWAPWKWMSVDMSYSFEDFSTDDEKRENYQENRGTIMFSVYPIRPPRMTSGLSAGPTDERVDVENKIYND